MRVWQCWVCSSERRVTPVGWPRYELRPAGRLAGICPRCEVLHPGITARWDQAEDLEHLARLARDAGIGGLV